MRDTAGIIGATIVLGGLAAISTKYNKWIDDQHLLRPRPDGETALWVGFGVLYTLPAAAALVSLWAHRTPKRRKWLIGPACLVAHLVAFVAAGIPMLAGDMRRQSALKQKQQIYDDLKRYEQAKTN